MLQCRSLFELKSLLKGIAMEMVIRGKAFVLGDNIDTDQIIPAEFLTYNPSDPAERKFFGKYALSGVPTEQAGLPKGNIRFVAEEASTSSEFAIDHRREELRLRQLARARPAGHRRGRLPRRWSPRSTPASSTATASTAATWCRCETPAAAGRADLHRRRGRTGPVETSTLTNVTTGKTFKLSPLGDVAGIIEAGGVFKYAKKAGMLK